MAQCKSLYEAQLAIMEEVQYVEKTSEGRNSRGEVEYRFASESDILAKVRPVLLKHRVVGPIPVEAKHIETSANGKSQRVVLGTRRFKFVHVPSKEEEVVEVFAEAGDPYGASGAMTIAKKFALREWLNLETGADPEFMVRERSSENYQWMRRAVTAMQECKSVKELDGKWQAIEGSEEARWIPRQLEELRELKEKRVRDLSQHRRGDDGGGSKGSGGSVNAGVAQSKESKRTSA